MPAVRWLLSDDSSAASEFSSLWRRVPAGALVASVVLLATGCSDGGLPLTAGPDLAGSIDLGPPDTSSDVDLGDPCPSGDDPGDGGATCGTPCTPDCPAQCLGPAYNRPFPMQSDPVRDYRENDSGLTATVEGNLVLARGMISFNFVWAPNSTDWQRGTVSKIDTKTVREVARYYTVTCSSLKTGSKLACDGIKGCCAADDADRYAARLAGNPEPGHQGVQLTDNLPSRTSVDFNGDLTVANRAPMGQASITRIASNASECIDRNKNGRIDSSSDVNADGRIETDCNGDGLPDDMDGVKVRACLNGMKQEFFGLDDECVLWTSNVDAHGQEARALGRIAGANNTFVSDAAAVTLPSATLTTVDGATGAIKRTALLPAGCQPNGVTVDTNGIMWAVGAGQTPLCYYDTISGVVGKARDSKFGGAVGYGLTLDRDENVWISGGTSSPVAYRYTPDRTNGDANLGAGFWLTVHDIGVAGGATGPAKGMSVDSRTANQFFAFVAVADGHIAELPASSYAVAKQDEMIDGAALPLVNLAPYKLVTAAVDTNQNVWAFSAAPSAMIRVSVDRRTGVMTQPNLVAPAQGMNACPAGDRCALKDNNQSEPGLDGYSDLSDFTPGDYRVPAGDYSYVFEGGCHTKAGARLPTYWTSVDWDAQVPPNTLLSGRIRTGPAPIPEQTWGAWTTDANSSPLDLALLGFDGLGFSPASYLQIEFTLKTARLNVTPTLKSFCVHSRCAPGSP